MADWSPLAFDSGVTPNIAKVSQPMLEALSVGGAGALPSGYTAKIVAGYDPSHGDSDSQHRAKGSGAIDLKIYGPDGREIPNRGADSTGMYGRVARGAYGYLKQHYPDQADKFNWGNSFSASKTDRRNDIMHYDMGGRLPYRQKATADMRRLGPLDDTKTREFADASGAVPAATEAGSPALDARGKSMVEGLRGQSWGKVSMAMLMSPKALAVTASAFGHPMTTDQARQFQKSLSGMTEEKYNKLQAGNLPYNEWPSGLKETATSMYGSRAALMAGPVNDAFAGRKPASAIVGAGGAPPSGRGLAPNIGASYHQLRSLGFNPQAARGIVANQMRETLGGGDIRPTITGKPDNQGRGGGEWGVFQLKGDNLTAYNTWADANKLDRNSLETQNKWFASQPGMIDKLNGMKDPSGVATALLGWENPADKTAGIAKNLAYEKQLAANDVPGGGADTFNRPTGDHVNSLDPTHQKLVDGRLASVLPMPANITDAHREGAIKALQETRGLKPDATMSADTWHALDFSKNLAESKALGGYPIGSTPAPGWLSPHAPVGHDATGHALHSADVPMSTNTAATIAGGVRPRLRPNMGPEPSLGVNPSLYSLNRAPPSVGAAAASGLQGFTPKPTPPMPPTRPSLALDGASPINVGPMAGPGANFAAALREGAGGGPPMPPPRPNPPPPLPVARPTPPPQQSMAAPVINAGQAAQAAQAMLGGGGFSTMFGGGGAESSALGGGFHIGST